MKANILLVSKCYDGVSQIAEGWLRSFDEELRVVSAATLDCGKLNEMAVRVMQEAGIDISDQLAVPISKCLTENWNYLIAIDDAADMVIPKFKGNIMHKMKIAFNRESSMQGLPMHSMADYLRARDDIRFRLFDFYLKDLVGKEGIGSDSCGVECELDKILDSYDDFANT